MQIVSMSNIIGTLHIRSTSLEDNGTFTCVAANSEGSVNSSANLLVRSKWIFKLMNIFEYIKECCIFHT